MQQLHSVGYIEGYELGFLRGDHDPDTLQIAFSFYTQYGKTPIMALTKEHWEEIRDKIDTAWTDPVMQEKASKEHMNKMMDQPEYDGP